MDIKKGVVRMIWLMVGVVIGIIANILANRFNYDKDSICIGYVIAIITIMILVGIEGRKLREELNEYKFNEYVMLESQNDEGYKNGVC